MNLNNLLSTKKVLSIIAFTGWCGLGFVRGVNSYKYQLNKYSSDAEYLYLDAVWHGAEGIFFYTMPFFLPITIYKEIYRFEVLVRNLEKEKKSSYYNDLYF